MRSLALLLFPLLALWPTSLAQENSGSPATPQQLPTCALLCLSQEIPRSVCQFTDTDCLCTNVELQGKIEACVLQSCKARDSLTTKNVTSTTCGAPVVDKGESTRVSNIVLSTLSAVVVMVRLSHQMFLSSWVFGLDDYTVFIAWLAGIPAVVIIDRGALPSGLGRDIWTLPFYKITNFVRWLYVLGVLYIIQVTFLKLTLLMFFLRMFPGTVTRRLLWTTVGFTIAWGVPSLLLVIFECRPIPHLWESWDTAPSPQCINVNALAWSHAVISIVLDFWMLALPLFVVSRLQMSWRKKASVTLMFCVGTFVTIVSIIRLQSLVHFAVSKNYTMDQREAIHWSNIEVNTALICACMPNLRLIVGRFLPKLMDMTSKGNSRQIYSSNGPRSMGKSKEGASANNDLESGITTRGSHTIIRTKSFEVQHMDIDEMPLVEINGITIGTRKGSNSSISASSNCNQSHQT